MKRQIRRVKHHISQLTRRKRKLLKWYQGSLAVFAFVILFSQNFFLPQAEILVGEPTTSIHISGTMYGKPNLKVGLTVPSFLTVNDVQTLTTLFPNTKVLLKMNNPNPGSLNASFEQLTNRGFVWYFSLPQDMSTTSFLTAFINRFPGKQAVVEIRTTAPDGSFLTNLKSTFPSIPIHVESDGSNWNDSRINQAFHIPGFAPPALNAVSFGNSKTSDWADGVFNSIRARFDMLYDGSLNFRNTINYPTNARMALSNMRISSPGPQENMSFWAGVLSSGIANNVQMRNHAFLTHLLYGDTNLPDNGKHILRYAADFLAQTPDIIWPAAFSANGNIWDSDLPFVGVIGKTSSGYFIFMTNTSSSAASASFPSAVNLMSYQFYSNQRGNGSFATSATQIAFQPFEVIIGTVGLPVISPVPPSPTFPPGFIPSPTSFTPPVGYMSPTPEVFYSPHFKVVGNVFTGTIESASIPWQSGDLCGEAYASHPKLTVSGSTVGRYGNYSLCDPDPFYLYTAYGPGELEASGPVTLSLENLPPGYVCSGWLWASGDVEEIRTGTGCSVTGDFRQIPPVSETGNHYISFFIYNPISPSPTPLPPPPTRKPRTTPTRTPTPFVSLVPVSIPAMAVQLGSPPAGSNPVQSFFFWISGLIRVFVAPPPAPSPAPSMPPSLTPYPSMLPAAPPTIVLGPPAPIGGSNPPGPGPIQSPVPKPPSMTPTPTIKPSPTPTTVLIDCPPPSGKTFDTLSESLPSYPPGDPPAQSHPDLNLTIRGYQPTTGQMGLILYSGATAPQKPPQLSTLFGGTRAASFFRLYQVYNWNWATNSKGGLATNFPVTLAGLVATPGEKLYPPFSAYDVGEDKPVATDPYQVLVVYAAANRITLKYDRTDSAASGFMLHLENICVDPNLVARYNQSNSGGRRSLPALRTRDSFGVARANEVIIAIRGNGAFLDPRSRKDWWQ